MTCVNGACRLSAITIAITLAPSRSCHVNAVHRKNLGLPGGWGGGEGGGGGGGGGVYIDCGFFFIMYILLLTWFHFNDPSSDE